MEVLLIHDLDLGWDNVVAVLPKGKTVEDYINWAVEEEADKEYLRKMFAEGTLRATTQSMGCL